MTKRFVHDERQEDAWVYLKWLLYVILVKLQPHHQGYLQKMGEFKRQIQELNNLKLSRTKL